MTYTIENDVTPPARSKDLYPWPEMDAGDSILVKWEERTKARASAASFVKRFRSDLKVVTKREENGVRIWFVEKSPLDLLEEAEAHTVPAASDSDDDEEQGEDAGLPF